MNSFKETIACLMVLGFLPSAKAVAGDWSYDVKVGAATSFSRFKDQTNAFKQAIKGLQKAEGLKKVKALGSIVEGLRLLKSQKKLAINSSTWHPWFGVAPLWSFRIGSFSK